MRYLIQFLIPALIVIGVAYLVARQKPQGEQSDGAVLSTPLFILVLVVGALFTLAILYVIGAFTDGA